MSGLLNGLGLVQKMERCIRWKAPSYPRARYIPSLEIRIAHGVGLPPILPFMGSCWVTSGNGKITRGYIFGNIGKEKSLSIEGLSSELRVSTDLLENTCIPFPPYSE